MQIAQLKDLIGKGRADKALKTLYEWAARHDDEILNNTIMLQGRLNRLERQANMGLITSAEVNMERNRITYAILAILGELEEHPKLGAATSSSPVPNASSSNNATVPDTVTGKRMFISYAREDRSYVDQLEQHLHPLINNGLVSTWSDSEIKPGQQWSKEIKDNLLSADIILFIVSANFLASDFINKNERIWAREAKSTHNATIVPVIVRPCYWTGDKELASLNAVPKNSNSNGQLIPVSNWNNQDDAYLAIIQQLATLISD